MDGQILQTPKQLIQTSGTILVNKRAESVFDFFANPCNDTLWRTEINTSTSDGPIQLGVTISEYSNLSKKAPNNLVELKCIQFERNKIVVFETPANSQFYLKSVREVKSISDNTTEILYAIQFDKALIKFALGFSLPKFIISYKAKTDMKKYLRQLKAKIEID